MKSYIKCIINNKLVVITLLIFITIGFSFVATKGIIASSIGNLFFGDDHPEYQKYKTRIQNFANDEVFIISYEEPDPFSNDHIQKLQKIVNKIREIEEVDRVDSILNAQQIFTENDTLFVKNYSNQIIKNPSLKNDLTKALINDSLYNQLLISKDGKKTSVIVELLPDQNRPVERGPSIVQQTLDIFQEIGFEKSDLHCIGLMATLSEIMSQTHFNFCRLFPIVCILLLLTLYAIFKNFWPVIITIFVSMIAVIWTIGFSVMLDRNISIFVAITPAIILIIATSDVIHLCSAYIIELGQQKTKELAILTSCTEVGKACFMTSITTCIGFFALSFIPVPAFRHIGWVLGFGVAVALALAVTLTPIVFCLLKPPDSKRFSSSIIQNILSKVLTNIRIYVINNPLKIIIIMIIIVSASVLGASKLTIETNFNERLDPENSIRIDDRFIKTHFAGANTIDIFIDSKKQDGLLYPEIFSKIIVFQKQLLAMPQVDKVVSVVDLIERIDKVLNTSADSEFSNHFSKELLAQYILLFEMSGGQDLDRLINFDRKSMRMAVRLSIDDVRRTYETGNQIKKLANKIFLGDSISVETTGLTWLMGMFLDDVINGQQKGIIITFISILLLMILWTKSIKTGLWAMIPNILPLIVLWGYLGFFWEKVDSDTLPIMMIAIGIAVDDTIHLIMRLRFETQKSKSTLDSLSRSFHYSGRAILITTIILVAGFMPFAISDYLPVRILGTLLPGTLIIALLADILLIPAFVKLKFIQFDT